ncbi:MAG: RsmB/NOP family class I SAM-dependent RNA methyltransferase [Alphaproteobacteria bacterium]|nr:RsmB/NOP family class I SAM-dependent RNA methyltransferase [Alphaproteobacteria bacterium]
MHPKALLDACTELVKQALPFAHPADAVVSRFFRQQHGKNAYGSRDRAVLAETLYHVLRHKLRFEHFAPSGSGPRERRLAILGFAQHLTDQRPQDPGATDFLKSALTEQEKSWLDACLAIEPGALLDRHRYSLPDWLADILRTQCADPADFQALAAGLLQTAPVDLRVNALSGRREDVQQELKLLGIDSQLTPYSPWGLRLNGKPALTRTDAFARGAIEVQDEGSQLLALLVEARRGEMVVDFCAGAGGKTLALGAQMRSTGRLYALDTSAHRLDALKPRLARSQLSNVHPSVIAHERDERVKRLSGKIDRVLVDAPCSGLGTLRRNPDLKWRQNPSAVAEMQARQMAILTSAARLLKPGGRLVYATCSLLPQENEEVVSAFDAAHPGWQPLQAAEILRAQKIGQADDLCTGSGRFLRLWPHRHATDGFFASIWQAK